MSTLNLSEPLPPSEPIEQKSSTTAFLLSLLLPGAGHFYIGEKGRGAVVMGFFLAGAALAATLVLGEGGEAMTLLGGAGARAAIFLYAFAQLDAYFTARENNRGQNIWVPENPRVAAILNLLTNGFGYFYLGERTKGLVVFFIGQTVSRALRATPSFSAELVVELIMAALAFDAWRIGNRMRQEGLAAAGHAIQPPASEGAINPIIPKAIAVCTGLLYASLVVVGTGMADLPVPTSAKTQTSVLDTGGARYRSAPFGVQLDLPPDWEAIDAEEGELWSFETSFAADHYCFARVYVESVAFSDVASFGDSMASDFSAVNRVPSSREETQLGGLPGGVMQFPATDEMMALSVWYAGQDAVYYTIAVGGEDGEACHAYGESMAQSLQVFPRSQ